MGLSPNTPIGSLPLGPFVQWLVALMQQQAGTKRQPRRQTQPPPQTGLPPQAQMFPGGLGSVGAAMPWLQAVAPRPAAQSPVSSLPSPAGTPQGAPMTGQGGMPGGMPPIPPQTPAPNIVMIPGNPPQWGVALPDGRVIPLTQLLGGAPPPQMVEAMSQPSMAGVRLPP